MSDPYWLAYIGSWLGFIWAIFRLFKEAGDTVNNKTKKAASLWLQNLDHKGQKSNWPQQFAAIFDQVFTRNHWSFKCFKFSFVTSFIAFTLVSLVSNISDKFFANEFGEQGRASLGLIETKIVAGHLQADTLISRYSSLKRRINHLDSIYDDLYLDHESYLKYHLYTDLVEKFNRYIYKARVQGYRSDRTQNRNSPELEPIYWRGIRLDSLASLQKHLLKERNRLQSELVSTNKSLKNVVVNLRTYNALLDLKKGASVKLIMVLLFIFIYFNAIPDYFSLLETRYIIKRMATTNSIVAWFLYLILDFCLTIAIFLLAAIVFSPLVNWFFNININPLRFLSNIQYGLRTFDSDYFSVFFYTTFFTSIWIWGYLLSGLILKLITPFRGGLLFLKSKLDIDNKPFRSMGVIIVTIISIIYLIGALKLLSLEVL
ncbi:MAG: hypothetical protein F6K19_44975 [Cyanothece sp. SIO1E1]|nr:hypothetical protein [Cyanothece sp. SIO1E1]